MSGTSPKKNGRGRNIGLLGAIAIGIGGMVGGGIFAVLGEAVSLAHGATAVAFILAGIVAALTSYSYARLAVTFPNRGGTVTFIDHAFGHNLLSGSINFMLWLSYLVTISLYAVAFTSYGLTFFPGHSQPWLRHLLISLVIANSIDLTEIAIIGSAGFLLIFFLVNLSAFKLGRAISASRPVTLLAGLASGAALVTLFVHTFVSNRRAAVVFVAFLAISFLFEFFYGRLVRGHFFQRRY